MAFKYCYFVLKKSQSIQKKLLNPLLSNVPILHTMKKKQKACGFLVFSRATKWEHWPKIGQINIEPFHFSLYVSKLLMILFTTTINVTTIRTIL